MEHFRLPKVLLSRRTFPETAVVAAFLIDGPEQAWRIERAYVANRSCPGLQLTIRFTRWGQRFKSSGW